MKPGLLKDVTILGCAVVLVALLLIGFHRCTTLGKGLSVDGYAIVGTTLFAAVLGFGAVMLQLRDQHRNAREEHNRHKLAVMRALLFEIHGFYRYHLRDTRDYLKSFDLAARMPVPIVKLIGANAFSIYQGNAGTLGELEAETLEWVVEFYNAAGKHVSTLSAWKASTERILRRPNDTVQQEAARRLATEIQKALPLQIGQAWFACKKLSERLGLKFDDLDVSRESDPSPIAV
jgi:hypothetical protein